MSFGKELIEKRKELNFTQEDLAQFLGKHKRTIQNWERELCFPDEKTRREVCRKLGIDLERAEIDYDSDLFPDEQQLLRIYRRLNADAKSVVQHLAEVLDSYQVEKNQAELMPRVEAYAEGISKGRGGTE